MNSPSAIHTLRLGGIEAEPPQRVRPVAAKIDARRAPIGGRGDRQAPQRLGFELDDSRLIDLVDGGARRPPQPIGPGVQPRRQDHRLPNTGPASIGEEVVEESGADREKVGQQRESVVVTEITDGALAAGDLGEEVDSHGADQWLGERVVDQPGPVGQSPGRRYQCRGSPDAGGRIPGVVICSRHGQADPTPRRFGQRESSLPA